jgi:hypothetical protein
MFFFFLFKNINAVLKNILGMYMWWCLPVFSAPGRLKQEDQKFEAPQSFETQPGLHSKLQTSLGHIEDAVSKKFRLEIFSILSSKIYARFFVLMA